ncbi:MAG TPA: hypothetical protein VMB52_00975 [Verrucomicrobiae bacterium]|nr:hypothetical protein [Verrucomicrobiae bacterium]
MGNTTNRLETTLNDIFVKSAPELPDGGRKFLVACAPVISLVIGILTLLSAWSLWHWARLADSVVSYANTVCNTYGGYVCETPVSRFTIWLWLGVVFLAAEGLLYLFAYSGLKDHKKKGWNYLYYGALLNLIYAIVSLFTSYDIIGHFIGAFIGSAVGFYLLFQIRDSYIKSKERKPATLVDSPKNSKP